MVERYSHPPEGKWKAVPLWTDTTDVVAREVAKKGEKYSRRGHMNDVAERVGVLIPDHAVTPSGQSMVDFVSLLAQIHDFGKLTRWFQQHIGMESGDPRSYPTHHSPIGAMLAYYVLEKVGYDDEECLAGYLAVAKHHGTLPDVPQYVFERTSWNQRSERANKQQRELIQQVDNIDELVPELAASVIHTTTDGAGSWDEFVAELREKTLFERIKKQVSYDGYTFDSDGLSEDLYPCVLQAWSALVLADKTSAAHAPMSGYDAADVSRSTLAAHIDQLAVDTASLSDREIQLNTWRDEARRSVLDNVAQLTKSNDSIATLTLPTGLGKTFTGLDAALTVRELTNRKRVIYALPFTSIIDQVVNDVKQIFNTDGTNNILTIHHHLTETVIKVANDEINTDSKAWIEKTLGESWRSGLVVTTYVQLFESLVGPKNSQSMKLPALYDSVIVLDEPQSLPHDWWPLVRRLADILAEEYNATIISMTATQPRLFGREVPELVDDTKQYFSEIERVEYHIHESIAAFPDSEVGPVPYQTAAEQILKDSVEGDVLSVCNTIDSAQSLTKAVSEQSDVIDVGKHYDALLYSDETGQIDGKQIAESVLTEESDTALLHLSTRIRPRDRLRLIDAMKRLTNEPVSLVVVSTQLIEAGVDVSFDRVYRDFAPIESIVQAAGRCNRSFEREQGSVIVWWLEPPDDKKYTPSEAVYELWGESLLSLTADVLDSQKQDGDSVMSESTISWSCVREYYDLLADERHVGKQTFVELLEEGKFEEAGLLSLIDQRLAIDVFVCRTSEDYQRIEEINDAWNSYDFDRVREFMDELKDTRVSIPVYSADSSEAQALGKLTHVHEETDIRWVDTRDPRHESYFDATTGLVAESSVENRFL